MKTTTKFGFLSPGTTVLAQPERARGAVAAYGLDYFKIGYTAGKKAARILKGEDPGKVPAGLASGYSLWISLKHARAQGIALPQVMVNKADKLWDATGKIVKGE